MCLSYIVSSIAIVILVYLILKQYNNPEGFYPHRWQSGYGAINRWNRPYMHDVGNWRPYGYYPAYSGYWKQCPTGSWCPPYVSCADPACAI